MMKSDLLKLLEGVSDDSDVVFLGDEGDFIDSIELIEEKVLGRFSHSNSSEIDFYASYRHYDNWKHLYDRKCAILG